MTSPPMADPGRTCPYCRFPLKPGSEQVSCPGCRASHHTECWAEAGGCAIVGCTHAPTATAATAAFAPPTPTSAAAAAPGPPEFPPPPAPRGPGRTGWVVAAVVMVLTLAIAGSAAAVILTRGGDDDGVAEVETVTVQQLTADEPGVEASDEPAAEAAIDDESADAAPADDETEETESEAADAITDVVRSHHQRLVDGDYAEAYALLSDRKQRQIERETGYSGWRSNQSDLNRYLSGVNRLTVEVEELDRRHGVATIRVSGPTFSLPGNRCGDRYDGITWAKRDDGAWHYEPGYSTTPQRRARWGSGAARDRTLAWTCWQR